MKKIFPFILLVSIFYISCSGSGHGKQYEEGYEEGYSKGYDEAYREIDGNMISYDDVLENVKESYDITDIYTQEELHEVIADIYSPDDLYDYDALIECLTNAGYVVTEAPKKELFYIGNMNTHVFHRPDCESVSRMNTHNIIRLSKEQLENRGYSPCCICEP